MYNPQPAHKRFFDDPVPVLSTRLGAFEPIECGAPIRLPEEQEQVPRKRRDDVPMTPIVVVNHQFAQVLTLGPVDAGAPIRLPEEQEQIPRQAHDNVPIRPKIVGLARQRAILRF